MPRTVREANLSTREARKRLTARKKPYYRSLDAGLHLGYRRSAIGAAWVIRWYAGEGKYRLANLEGRPDDVLPADGKAVLNWNEAQAKAREVFGRKQRQALGFDEDHGPYTVSQALTDYFAAYERRGGKAKRQMQPTIDAITRALGTQDVRTLRRSQVENWFHGLAEKGRGVRVKKDAEAKFRAAP